MFKKLNLNFRNMKVHVDGTFDKIHNCHKTLIKKAFEKAGVKESVFI